MWSRSPSPVTGEGAESPVCWDALLGPCPAFSASASPTDSGTPGRGRAAVCSRLWLLARGLPMSPDVHRGPWRGPSLPGSDAAPPGKLSHRPFQRAAFCAVPPYKLCPWGALACMGPASHTLSLPHPMLEGALKSASQPAGRTPGPGPSPSRRGSSRDRGCRPCPVTFADQRAECTIVPGREQRGAG